MPIRQTMELKPEKGSNSPTITQQVSGRAVGSNSLCSQRLYSEPLPLAMPFPLPRMPFRSSTDEKLLLGSIVHCMILRSREKGPQFTEALEHSGSEPGDLSLSWSLTQFQRVTQAPPQRVDFSARTVALVLGFLQLKRETGLEA